MFTVELIRISTAMLVLSFTIEIVYAKPISQPGPPNREVSVDAVDLASLAPTARRSTVEQSYGDASIARSRLQHGENANMLYSSRRIATSRRACQRNRFSYNFGFARYRRQIGSRQSYTLTPAYVSAPQNFAFWQNSEKPILPLITSFFWVANSLQINP